MILNKRASNLFPINVPPVKLYFHVKKDAIPVNAADEPKIAVIIDQGSPDVKDLLDLDELGEYTLTLLGVESVDVTPSAIDGSKIKEVIGTGDFNRMPKRGYLSETF
jgi:hypothetical protein